MEKNKIINEPNQMHPAKSACEGTVKVVFSMILTIFVVLLTLALWGFSGVYLYEHLFSPGYLQKTAEMFLFLLLIAFLAFKMMFLWQQYNFRVFGKKERRAFPPPVPEEQLEGMYSVAREDIALLRKAKMVWMELDNEEHSAEGPRRLTDDSKNVIKLGNFISDFSEKQEGNGAETTASVV